MSQALQEERGAALSPAVLSTAAPAVKSYQCYLVVSNPSSKNNLGNVIRCAAAFAVSELIVVGFDKWGTHGAHGSHKVIVLWIRCLILLSAVNAVAANMSIIVFYFAVARKWISSIICQV